jgi:hypothetical protein
MRLQAQSAYGTSLIEGSISFNIQRVYETYCQGRLSTRTESNVFCSSELTGTCISEQLLAMFQRSKNLGGEKLSMNNYTNTLKEGEVWNEHNDVPLFPISASIENKNLGESPCSSIHECYDGYNAVLTSQGSYSGKLIHHENKDTKISCVITNVEKCDRLLFFKIQCGGTYFLENSLPDYAHVTGEEKYLVCEEGKEVFKKLKTKSNLYVGNTVLTFCNIAVSDNSNSGWSGRDGFYMQIDEQDGTTTKKELRLMSIDTADFFRYVRKKPSMQKFTASGSFTEEITENQTGKKSIRSEIISVTLTLGKIPDFLITAVNEQEYKDWLPGNPSYPGSYKPVSVKAKFSEKSQLQEEKIVFIIAEASHLPGICTNYPLEPDEKDKEDIIFAPQDKQTDPNLKILNDSTAITTKPVSEAVVVLNSNDFGAFCKVMAMTESSGNWAECPYNNKKYISIPYDLNDNNIADKWEKDMGVEGINKLEDKDNLPTGQGSLGDGLTAFEEYRGFISEDDVIASCDPGHIQRDGKHIRTSTFCRDVFIYDADGLFAKYMANTNPAECHWHYVNREQISLPPMDQVTKVIKAYETDDPDANDKSNAASEAIIDNWIKKEYRRVNANTPKLLRITKQFGMYLLVSPLPSTTGGLTITKISTPQASPLQNNHLVVLPRFASMKAAQGAAINGLLNNSSHPALKAKYPASIVDQVIEIAYEAMVSHEVGHGLGIPHHKMGSIKVISANTKKLFTVNNANAGFISGDTTLGQCNEVCNVDGQEYLITTIQQAFWAMGVTECCMRYTLEREVDFLDMKVLQHSQKYCRKGKTFVDATGTVTQADGCFSKIQIRCVNE